MFVAPLNLDRFFKKVFSNKKIAKSFLEDLFNKKITELTYLGTDYKVTDDAVIVKFDFRCKIDGEYVQIEMQQKYKRDVNKRFYLYHCINTALQLETLKPIIVTKPNGKTYTEKDYSALEPVITIIWMVDDSLNFTEDIIVFSTLPEATKDFITNEDLWHQPLETILAEREKVITILNNTTKDLNFFAQNRLMYVLQKNIFRNKKLSKYFKWFYVAEKSRNPNNTEEDFSQFKDDKDMAEVLRRLEKSKLTPDEFEYISDLFQYENLMAIRDAEFDISTKKAEEKFQAELQAERQKTQEERQKRQSERKKAIEAFLILGKDIPAIAGILDLTIDEVTDLAHQIEAQKP
jgi:hypothetical protein